jgi:hypothetical protein
MKIYRVQIEAAIEVGAESEKEAIALAIRIAAKKSARPLFTAALVSDTWRAIYEPPFTEKPGTSIVEPNNLDSVPF